MFNGFHEPLTSLLMTAHDAQRTLISEKDSVCFSNGIRRSILYEISLDRFHELLIGEASTLARTISPGEESK